MTTCHHKEATASHSSFPVGSDFDERFARRFRDRADADDLRRQGVEEAASFHGSVSSAAYRLDLRHFESQQLFGWPMAASISLWLPHRGAA